MGIQRRRRLRTAVGGALLLLLLVAALVLAACGGSSTAASSSPSVSPSVAVASPSASATPTPTPTVAGSIAFEINHNGYGLDTPVDISTIRTDGTGLKHVAHEALISEEYPAWSPDGRKIEYSRGQGGGFYNLWVMNADGSGKKRLTHGRLGGVNGGWSPDGRRIVYSSWFYPENTYPPAHVFVMNADGSSPHELTRGPHYDLYPVWAGNSRILFLRKLMSLEGDRGDVFSVRSDGSGLTRVTRLGEVGGFAPSPTGKLLVVHDKKHGRIVVMPLGASGSTRTLLDTDFGWDYVTLSWAPDGKALVLGHFAQWANPVDSLYVVNADGSGLSCIPGVMGFNPAWRPE